MSDEAAICDRLHQWQKDGAIARHTGTSCPHPPNTLASFMYNSGWLTENLRLALCRANPSYAWGQAQFDKTLNGIGPAQP